MEGMRLVLATVCVLLSGCHESLGLVGDARLDTRLDTGIDPAPEPAFDTGVDVDLEPPPPCPPPNPHPDGPLPYWEVDDPWSWPPGLGMTMRCNIEEVAAGDDNSFTVFLACPDPSDGWIDEHTLYVRSEVPFWLHAMPGEEVVLAYNVTGGWWTNRWFTLRNARGEFIMAGVDADTLTSGMDPDHWFDPGFVQVVERDWCPPESTMCGRVTRRGLEVRWGGITAEFVDRTYGSMGFMESVQVHVGETHRYLEMDCDDMPDEWVSALFIFVPEG